MRFAAGLSDSVNARVAAEAACQHVLEQLAGAPCHAAFLFVSSVYRADWSTLLGDIHARLQPEALIGCSAGGVIGGDQELEWVPALSIVGAHLPGVRLHPFAVGSDALELSGPGGFWIDTTGAAPNTAPSFLLFADPYTCDPAKLLQELNATYPHRPVMGGLVSGGNAAGEHALFSGQDVLHEGAVGLALTGNVAIDAIVSQGCRPVGRSYVVTKADGNAIEQLGGRGALAVLHEVLTALKPDDRILAQQGALFIGVVIDEMRHRFAPGDFLIRHLVGLDPATGALAMSDRAEVGQTVQFHLRDAHTSREELRKLLVRGGQVAGASPPAGALLFNCLGRGKALYGVAHHDARTIQTVNGRFPLGGFFCNGEIGPVGGINFLHGYTASLCLFRAAEGSAPIAPA